MIATQAIWISGRYKREYMNEIYKQCVCIDPHRLWVTNLNQFSAIVDGKIKTIYLRALKDAEHIQWAIMLQSERKRPRQESTCAAPACSSRYLNVELDGGRYQQSNHKNVFEFFLSWARVLIKSMHSFCSVAIDQINPMNY